MYKRLLKWIFLWLFLPSSVHASFIESTVGTAVVNDATAAYHNPAALLLLKNSQLSHWDHLLFFERTSQVRQHNWQPDSPQQETLIHILIITRLLYI